MFLMLKESFLGYLSLERNYSSKTVRSYGIDLTQFESYFRGVDQDLDYTDIDADLIRGWVISLMDEGYTATSVNRKLSSLRSFYHFLLRKQLVSVDPMAKINGPKKKKPLPVFVKEADMNCLLDDTDFGKGFESVRDRTVLEVFYTTGIRLSELIGLDDADVDFSARVIKVTGKRNKQRLVPFGDELEADMQAYLSERNENCPRVCPAFFVRKDGERLYPQLVYRIVKRNLSKVVTLKKKSPRVEAFVCDFYA